ncbi:STAS domain-containing protein [Planosporangium flavigriseum]|nr:STAS domain-containing protein [Planosporangium flavigriseum]
MKNARTMRSIAVRLSSTSQAGASGRRCGRRPARIVVDLMYLTFIDSTGIGALVAGNNAVRAVGVAFSLRNPGSFVIAQLNQTGRYNTLVGGN